MQTQIISSIEEAEQKRQTELKSDISFYMNHLSSKELNMLKDLASSLAVNYSRSYHEWRQSI